MQMENLNSRWLERFAVFSATPHAQSFKPVRRFVTTGTSATFSGGKTACIDTRCEIRFAVRTILFGANDTTRNQGVAVRFSIVGALRTWEIALQAPIAKTRFYRRFCSF